MVEFDLIGVASTNIANAGYNEEKKVMRVTFLNNSQYDYFGVPKKIFVAFMKAPSKGSYLHTVIKGRFPFSRVR